MERVSCRFHVFSFLVSLGCCLFFVLLFPFSLSGGVSVVFLLVVLLSFVSPQDGI